MATHTIDMGDKFPHVDITNIAFSDYSLLMMALDTLIIQLTNNTMGELYDEENRKRLLAKYKALFDKLKLEPWHGQAISIDGQIIAEVSNTLPPRY